MRNKYTQVRWSFFLVLFSLPGLAQNKFEVVGPGSITMVFTEDDLRGLHTITHADTAKDGQIFTYRGVDLMALLKKAGTPSGKDLRRENLQKSVLITATDGYKVIFSLSELDSEFSGRSALMAFEKNGKALPEQEGPFRLIVPGDLRTSRWVRGVRSVKVLEPKN